MGSISLMSSQPPKKGGGGEEWKKNWWSSDGLEEGGRSPRSLSWVWRRTAYRTFLFSSFLSGAISRSG